MRPNQPIGRTTLRPPAEAPPSLGPLIVGAALLALAELLAGVLLGDFLAAGRAEPAVFYLFRPWLLLVAVLAIQPRTMRRRLALYAGYLLLASVAEAVLLWRLGGGAPAFQAILLAALFALPLVAVADGLAWFANRLGGRAGASLALAGCAALLLATDAPRRLPDAPRLFSAADSQAEASISPSPGRRVGLLTALPLLWGEEGAFAPGARSSEAYRLLDRRFDFVPLDALGPATLRGQDVLLLAQPRALAPGELVAIDRWIRDGGRALLLTDPALRWPSELALGDIRRPPPIGLLGPLLDHWGLALLPPDEGAPTIVDRRIGGRRLVTAAPGRLERRGTACHVMASGLLARCRIGRGEAMVLADADLLHDALWTGPGAGGAERSGRQADNPRVVSDLLDALLDRAPASDAVGWFEPGRDPVSALANALAVLGFALLIGAVLRFYRRRFTDLSTG